MSFAEITDDGWEFSCPNCDENVVATKRGRVISCYKCEQRVNLTKDGEVQPLGGRRFE